MMRALYFCEADFIQADKSRECLQLLVTCRLRIRRIEAIPRTNEAALPAGWANVSISDFTSQDTLTDSESRFPVARAVRIGRNRTYYLSLNYGVSLNTTPQP